MKYLVRFKPNPKGTVILRRTVQARSVAEAVETVLIGMTPESFVSVWLDEPADPDEVYSLLMGLEQKAINDDTRGV